MSSLNVKTELVLKGKKYEITFPNVGQLRRIASNKALLSNGMYNSIYTMASEDGDEALDIIDIESTLNVVAPDFIEDLKPLKISELGLKDFREISKAYKETFVPWFDGLKSELRK